MGGKDAYISLGEAANLAPWRVTANCVWRWCRKGVRARNGERIRLEHRRVGGRLFTRPEWIDDFSRAITEADAAFFASKDEAAARAEPREARYGPPGRRAGTRADVRGRDWGRDDRIRRQLDEAGL